MKLPELKAIARENKIKGRSILNKPEFIVVLKEKELLPKESITRIQQIKSNPVNDARYVYLKLIRKNPKRVKVEDVITGKIVEHPSLYKAGRALDVSSKRLLYNADKIMDDRYKITILVSRVSY